MKRRDFVKNASAASLLLPFASLDSLRQTPKPVLRFAVASDGHYGQPDTPYAKDFENLNRWMQTEKRKKGLDAVFVNGDLFHDDPVFLPQVKAAFGLMPAPCYVTRGNHDRVTDAQWQTTWGYPVNHDVVMGDYAFLLADTSNEKGEYLCANADWLGQTLQKHAKRKGVFVFMHIPPSKRWTDAGMDCPPVAELLEKTPNVTAIFHGHDHDNDFRKISGGKPYFFDGHFGGSWGTAYKGYRIVEVFADGAWQSYQCNPAASPIVNSHQGKSTQY